DGRIQQRSTKAGAEAPARGPLAQLGPRAVERAQRRPGPKPRRVSLRRLSHGPQAQKRSTKAGAEAPARGAAMRSQAAYGDSAQRRPGPKPRRVTGSTGSSPSWAALNE